MIHFRDEWATAAEAWVVELADGRLLGACWNLNQRDSTDFCNAFALSHDNGLTWSPTQSTSILGQSCALAPLPDGTVLFVYNQRKHGQIGVWLSHVQLKGGDFNIMANEIVWEAAAAGPARCHGQWTEFTFGEPSATLLEDETILITFWTLDQGVGNIRYVKLRLSS
jgi:hypothetical protein